MKLFLNKMRNYFFGHGFYTDKEIELSNILIKKGYTELEWVLTLGLAYSTITALRPTVIEKVRIDEKFNKDLAKVVQER